MYSRQLSGQCKGNYCKRNEACMPKGLNYYCVPLSNIFPECGTKLRPRDCSDLPVGSASGVYTIYPTNAIFDVYCEMDTAGFGWTVFQSRMNGSTDFYRGWIDYENGFGSLTSEFWLGNKFIHLLTSTGDYKLYVHLEDFEGKSAYAEYSGFSLGGTATDHTLNVGGYCGTAGDSLVSNDERTQNGMMFSSYDKDNDRSPKSCELQYKGAWWYSWCHRSNLNGQYLGGKHLSTADGINWATWRGVRYSLKSTKMMIKLH
ncbi:fibrinogen C domain-containing protein 1-like [Mytilus trossulus]|uniref:fibrinogen C domain-containing protein 1-like n=1 Tax=Mytilus trossulus TaxID=6551 RepID=UPI003004E1AC